MDSLQLRQRERLAHKLQCNYRVAELFLQTLARPAQDSRVIKRQLRQRLEIEQPRIPRVASCLDVKALVRNQRDVRDRNDAFARVPVGMPKSLQLFQIRRIKAGLFAQLAPRGPPEALVHLDEAARQSPTALKGRGVPPYQQYFEFALCDREHNDVNAHGRMRVLVGISHTLYLV